MLANACYQCIWHFLRFLAQEECFHSSRKVNWRNRYSKNLNMKLMFDNSNRFHHGSLQLGFSMGGRVTANSFALAGLLRAYFSF